MRLRSEGPARPSLEDPGGPHASRWGPVIADRFDPTANGLTALRLALALAVLTAHVWDAGGYGPDPVESVIGRPGLVGTLAVLAFFGLSGFLLATSRQRQDRATFMLRRALRIFPGYWFAIAISSVVVGGWYIGAAWFPGPFVSDVRWAAWADHVYSNVNVSLWTLWTELVCYAFLALTPVGWLTRSTAVAAIVLATMAFVPEFQVVLRLVAGPSAFMAGVAMARFQTRVPLVAPYAFGCLAFAIITFDTVAGVVLGPVAIAYAAVWAASAVRFRTRADLSYGTYLLAFPVTQVLLEAGLPGPWILLAATVALTLPLAAVSWYVVERPMLGIRWRRRKLAVAQAPSAVTS